MSRDNCWLEQSPGKIDCIDCSGFFRATRYMLKHSDTKLGKIKRKVDQNLEGVCACCSPAWIRHCYPHSNMINSPVIIDLGVVAMRSTSRRGSQWVDEAVGRPCGYVLKTEPDLATFNLIMDHSPGIVVSFLCRHLQGLNDTIFAEL